MMVLVLQACSLTDVDSATSNGVSKTPKLSKSSSAGNTPINSHESSLSSIGSRLGLRNSEKKKEKADIKKMKVCQCCCVMVCEHVDKPYSCCKVHELIYNIVLRKCSQYNILYDEHMNEINGFYDYYFNTIHSTIYLINVKISGW